MSDLTVAVFFTQTVGVPATGLALGDVRLYLTAQARATGIDIVIWDGSQAATGEMDNIGAYTRIYTGADLENYNYYARGTYVGAVVLDSDHATGAVGMDDMAALAALILAALLANQQIAEAVRMVDLYMYRGDTWTQTYTWLGDLTGVTEIWFAVKEALAYADAQATILITLTGGLEIINGATAPVPANGSITVVGAPTAGTIQIDLDEVETAKIAPDRLYQWDIQMLVGGVVTTPKAGQLVVSGDVARAVI